MFKRFAFEGGISPSDAHEQLSIRASQLAHGLPSTLEAFGSLFRGKITPDEWEAELRTLETTPHENTMKISKISYNDLDAIHKKVFLHIACLFNGDSILRVRDLLDNFEVGIKVLSDKSLINISNDGYLKMHALVEQSGRQIVLEESKKKASETGTDQIQCLALHMCEMSRKLAINSSNIRPLYNIKILKFYKHLDDIDPKLQFVSEDHLQPPELELRLLHWDAYPLTTLPFNLYLKCLVEFNFRYRNLESLWDGTPELENLRRLDVTGSKNLRELPNISKAMKLEDLLMGGCTKLEQLPRYIGSLSNLGKLHAIDCDGLQNLEIRIRNIYKSDSEIKLEFPNEVWSLQFLENLSMEGKISFSCSEFHGVADHFSFSSISCESMWRRQLPRPKSTFLDFKCLEIKRNNYTEDGRPPFRFVVFPSFPLLAELNLINLKINYIPSNIYGMVSLKRLNLSGNDFTKLPHTLKTLSNLKYIDLRNCCNLEALPLPTEVETLILSECINLQSLLEHSNLEEDFGGFCLLELELDNCNNVQFLSQQLSHFTNLKELNLSRHEFMILPESIKELSSLRTLTLNNCKNLESLEELPLSLKYLNAHCCCLLRNVSLSFEHSLEEVDLHHCFRLKLDVHGITRLPPNRHGEKVPRECGCSQETESRIFT